MQLLHVVQIIAGCGTAIGSVVILCQAFVQAKNAAKTEMLSQKTAKATIFQQDLALVRLYERKLVNMIFEALPITGPDLYEQRYDFVMRGSFYSNSEESSERFDKISLIHYVQKYKERHEYKAHYTEMLDLIQTHSLKVFYETSTFGEIANNIT